MSSPRREVQISFFLLGFSFGSAKCMHERCWQQPVRCHALYGVSAAEASEWKSFVSTCFFLWWCLRLRVQSEVTFGMTRNWGWISAHGYGLP